MSMMCDIIYAGDKAEFGQPEIVIGTIPGEKPPREFLVPMRVLFSFEVLEVLNVCRVT